MADAVDTQRSLFVRGVRLANEASGEDALLGGGRDPRVVAARDRLLAMHAAALAALRQSIGAADGRTPESRDMAAGAQRLVAQLEERSAALARLRSPAHAQSPARSPTKVSSRLEDFYRDSEDEGAGEGRGRAPAQRRAAKTAAPARRRPRTRVSDEDDEDEDYVEDDEKKTTRKATRKTTTRKKTTETTAKKSSSSSSSSRGTRKKKDTSEDNAVVVVVDDDDDEDDDTLMTDEPPPTRRRTSTGATASTRRSTRKRTTAAAASTDEEESTAPKTRKTRARSKKTTLKQVEEEEEQGTELPPTRSRRATTRKAQPAETKGEGLPPTPPSKPQQRKKAEEPFEVPTLPADFRPSGTGPQKGSREDKERRAALLRSVDRSLIEAVLNDVVSRDPGVHWGDIGGLHDVKRALYEAVILPCTCPELFSGLRRAARGLLLFGPPGNGKTMIAKAVATESHTNFFSVSASSLVSKWVGQSEKMVKALFAVARYLQPAVIFIDEVDSLLSRRKDDENEAMRRVKTEFLVQFDGVGSGDGTEQVFVMAATNRPQDLDEAALRRFTKRIYVPLPEEATREQILRHLLAKNDTTITPAELHRLARRTENYSAADLTHLCEEAAMFPLRDLSPGRIAAIAARRAPTVARPITYNDVVRASAAIRASVSPQTLRELEAWDNKFGSQS